MSTGERKIQTEADGGKKQASGYYISVSHLTHTPPLFLHAAGIFLYVPL